MQVSRAYKYKIASAIVYWELFAEEIFRESPSLT